MSIGPYKRVLLKISGEYLVGQQKYGIDTKVVEGLCKELAKLRDQVDEMCLVVGGGNIFRGEPAADAGMERANADYIGMLATIINALALQHYLERELLPTRVVSSIPIQSICEPYIRSKALNHLRQKRVVIFAGGTGNPFFSTDTAAALRASEMNCDIIIKATKVDGVYDKDPLKNSDAKRFDKLSITEAMHKRLKVMDSTALALCRENEIPIVVLSLLNKTALSGFFHGSSAEHTLITAQ